MIGFINGVLEEINGNTLVISCGGVGFEILASQNTISKLADVGQTVKVYTHLNVREDEMSLFGFATIEEKSMFNKLTLVSGIGPKTAISILSEISLYDLATAILSGDATAISKVKGIGKKTAERIVLELKEKIVPPTNAKMPTEKEKSTESRGMVMALGQRSITARQLHGWHLRYRAAPHRHRQKWPATWGHSRMQRQSVQHPWRQGKR